MKVKKWKDKAGAICLAFALGLGLGYLIWSNFPANRMPVRTSEVWLHPPAPPLELTRDELEYVVWLMVEPTFLPPMVTLKWVAMIGAVIVMLATLWHFHQKFEFRFRQLNSHRKVR